MAIRAMGRVGRVIQVWSLTDPSHRALRCVLEQQSSTGFVLVVTIDAVEVATRTCTTRSEAIGYAAFLLDRLMTDGWSVRHGIPQAALH